MDLDQAEFPEVLVSGVLFIQRPGGGGGGGGGGGLMERHLP